MYFISCANHLAWGYVDQPPLIAVIAKLSLALFGDSLYGIRLLPAVAASATVVLTGRLAKRLGGGTFAQILAMLGIALAPFCLAVGNLLTMNAFEPLLWMGAAYLFAKASESDRLSLWAALGLVCGLGLINKYSMFFYLGTAVVAIALTRQRRSLLRPGFALAVAIAGVIVAPTLVWQAQHGWPQLDVLRAAATGKNFVAGPPAFYLTQFLMMNPLTAPIWIAGIVSLVRGRTSLRWYGLTYVLLSVLYVVLGAKVYYLAPIYPVLFAAGAVPVAARIEAFSWPRAAYPALLLVMGLAIAPEAYPMLPLHTFLRYERILDFRSIKMEKHPEGLVPQHFADMLGWNTLVSSLADAYDRLSPAERREAVILTRDYGSGLGRRFPRTKIRAAPRDQRSQQLLSLRHARASGKLVLAIGIPEARLRDEFATVRQVGFFHDAYVLPDFNNLPIYACSHPTRPLAVWWPSMKQYI